MSYEVQVAHKKDGVGTLVGSSRQKKITSIHKSLILDG